MLRVLVCQNCGRSFEAKRSDAKWCAECKPVMGAQRFKAFEQRTSHSCSDCGKTVTRKSTRCLSCAQKLHFGAASQSWKTGKHRRTRDGYIEVRVAPGNAGRVLEHRYIWEQAHGPLPKNWVVHHLNGIKDDNRLENLVGMSRSHHGPRAHIDPSEYEARIRYLEARVRELEGS